jgi:hypothetical protein
VCALDALDLFSCLFDGHVTVKDAEPALAGHRNREVALGDGVHRCREDRDGQFDVLRDARGEVRVVGLDTALFGL